MNDFSYFYYTAVRVAFEHVLDTVAAQYVCVRARMQVCFDIGVDGVFSMLMANITENVLHVFVRSLNVI